MKAFFSRNWLVIVVAAIAIAQGISMGVTIRNNSIIESNNELRQEVELVKRNTNDIIAAVVHNIDLGVRGYALTRDPKLLDPYISTSKNYTTLFAGIETVLRKQGYSDLNKFYALRKEIDSYFEYTGQMVEMVEAGQMEEFTEMLKRDKGFDVWIRFSEFQQPLEEFENKLYSDAAHEYDMAMQTNLYLQLGIVSFSLPFLYFIVVRIRKERKARESLLDQVEENDRNFVFNTGVKRNLSADDIIALSISNTQKASEFIKSMANNNYQVEWDGLDESNLALNKDTLAGNLINMREQLKRVKSEDEKRNWMNEGLATFSELVRNNQHDSQLLADRCVSFLSKYLKSQQASLFVLEDDEDQQQLKLASCFAFDKKKWIEKTIEPGTGLIGQAFLEGETIQLKEVPKGYTSITSGLGDATPDFLVIVPLKYDVHIVAIIELASFSKFEPHHVMFLQKAGEFLASAILNSQNTQKMKNLLETARITEEQMRQREEEMRQNMEELQATQEELVRKEQEMQKRMAEQRISETNF
jgi:CHASE3 domain sensor protein